MSVQQPESFEILTELCRTDAFTALHARHCETRRDVRLTRLAKSLSESADFRAAFRKDQPSLTTFHHPNVLPFLYWGEDNGRVFYATELPNGDSLSDRLVANQTFSWDEFTDIGWQVASALQHAHNLGVTHGRLTTSSVIVSDELRVQVAGFGLYRWIAAATSDDTADDAVTNPAHQDLVDFGELLDSMLKSVNPETEAAADFGQVTELRNLINDLRDPPLDFTARDVQGRLGNILLRVAGDSIKMIDHRKGQGLSRRSIVDELFDESEAHLASASRSAASVPKGVRFRDWRIVLFLAIVLVLLTLWRLLSPWT